ncbi:TonB-dependent receptor plug domain-containing protein [Flavobacterium sp.]|uniref:TonB-dependent receptor plug domain-containing protein n=1 Tax=Flavobacterium sp. TaxID=239 RepID=UPI00286F39D8|nr:TonB-dependent receptor plug domain-containing protein [Flavobacterium sp.]
MKSFYKIVFFFLVFSFANAQTILSGKVLNYKKKPVTNASIYLDTIDSNVVTNKDGEFSLTVPEQVKIIKVHSKKYGWLSSTYNKETKMDFVYLETDKSKNEKGASNPQSLSLEKDKNTITYRTIYDMIRGKIAGVVVQPDNTIIIRGINSIKNNSEPLFIVDGSVVSSIDYIVPSEVKSITVLKDADASIYGSRGSSGVIVIKMKN